MICFSCGKYGHATDSCGLSSVTKTTPQEEVVQSAIQKPQVGYNKNLYGPWMIATSRRRRAAKANARGEVNGLEQGYTGGSRFTKLPVEEVRGDGYGELAPSEAPQVGSVEKVIHKESRDGSRMEHVVPQKTFTKNAAYLASNPERKKKKSGGAESSTTETNVVPLANGTGAHIVKHTVPKGMGNHNAISIVEPGYEANVGTSSKGAKGRKGSYKEAGEQRRLGFKVCKQTSERSAPTHTVVNCMLIWISRPRKGEFVDNSMDVQDLVVELDLPAHDLER
ncbi:hypothetical protein V6N13_084210 [Hibiscus sabdariffa]